MKKRHKVMNMLLSVLIPLVLATPSCEKAPEHVLMERDIHVYVNNSGSSATDFPKYEQDLVNIVNAGVYREMLDSMTVYSFDNNNLIQFRLEKDEVIMKDYQNEIKKILKVDEKNWGTSHEKVFQALTKYIQDERVGISAIVIVGGNWSYIHWCLSRKHGRLSYATLLEVS